MRAGGANITHQHIEDLSLSGIFLMRVVDSEFGSHQSSSHTTLDANNDISKLSKYLMEKDVTCICENRMHSPSWIEPTEAGLNKLCNTSWVKETLDKMETEDLEREEIGIVDASYELSDVNTEQKLEK